MQPIQCNLSLRKLTDIPFSICFAFWLLAALNIEILIRLLG